jgi:hypothetical protein
MSAIARRNGRAMPNAAGECNSPANGIKRPFDPEYRPDRTETPKSTSMAAQKPASPVQSRSIEPNGGFELLLMAALRETPHGLGNRLKFPGNLPLRARERVNQRMGPC